MSQNDIEWAHFNIRCENELRVRADASAKEQGQSLAEWIRRAIAEKLERESRAHPCGADAEIPAAMVEMMRAIAREEVKNAGTSVSMVNNGRDAKQDVKIEK